MYYSFLYQGIFGLAFLNFLVFWTDLFFSTYLLKSSKNYLIPLQNSEKQFKNGSYPFENLEFFTSTLLWFLLTSLLVFRYLKANHFPLANFYEALMFLTWCLVTLNLFLLFGSANNLLNIGNSNHNRLSNYAQAIPVLQNGQGSTLSTSKNFFIPKILRQIFLGEDLDPMVLKGGGPKMNQKKEFLETGSTLNHFILIYNQFIYTLAKPQKKIYGGILAPCILFIIAFAQFNLSTEFSPLVPALKSNWLLMHVSIMIFSYTIFIVAGLIALILIIQTYYPYLAFFNKNKNRFHNSNFNYLELLNLKTIGIDNKNIGPSRHNYKKHISEIKNDFDIGISQNRDQISFFWDYNKNSTLYFLPPLLEKTYQKMQITNEPLNFTNFIASTFFNHQNRKIVNFKVPSLTSQDKIYLTGFTNQQVPNKIVKQISNTDLFNVKSNLPIKYSQSSFKVSQQMKKNYFSISLDQISYRLFGIGFPLFTLGILSGAVWANSAWGSYWSWDIKETGSFINWLMLAFYLHCRYKNFITLSHIIAFISLIILFFNFFGISLGIFGSSLHAYGAAS